MPVGNEPMAPLARIHLDGEDVGQSGGVVCCHEKGSRWRIGTVPGVPKRLQLKRSAAAIAGVV